MQLNGLKFSLFENWPYYPKNGHNHKVKFKEEDKVVFMKKIQKITELTPLSKENSTGDQLFGLKKPEAPDKEYGSYLKKRGSL